MSATILTSEVDVRTEQYESNHGKRPRGEGWWLFAVRNHVADARAPKGFVTEWVDVWPLSADGSTDMSRVTSYSVARKLAVEAAAAQGHNTIYVMS